ncbi:MAG: DUF1573 domain-containing protein [Thermoguttaceae bacterium]|nr:DUF1573 domain-containing protein [Thermoguttaceae bacterium]
MPRRSVLLLLLVCGFNAPAWGQEWARKMFQATSHEFGTVARNMKTEYRFYFKNLYEEDIHIASATTSCGCTTVTVETPVVKSLQTGSILAHFNTDRYLGQRGATITVVIDKPYPATVLLSVKGYIRSDVVFEPQAVEFSGVDQGTPAERTITIRRIGNSQWQILDVKTNNPYLAAEVVRTDRTWEQTVAQIRVKLNEKAPAGYVRDHITLVTNDPSTPQVPVPVEGRVDPAVMVSPTELFLGVVHPGQKVTKQLVVRGKKPFRVLSVSSDANHFEFPQPSADEPRPLHVIPITFVATDQPGKVVERIRITTDLNDAASELATIAYVK